MMMKPYLHRLCTHKDNTEERVRQAISAGADPNAWDDNYLTALHVAIVYHQPLSIIQTLLNAGANPYLKNNAKETALHRAIHYHEALNLFLQILGNVDDQDKDGMTPLHLAVYHENDESMEMLLQHGAQVNMENNWGKTPLHLAASFGSPKTVETLLQHSANPNTMDKNGNTPLHMTFMNKNNQSAQKRQRLLAYGASIMQKNTDEQSSMDLAIKTNDMEAIALFEQYLLQQSNNTGPLHKPTSSFLRRM